MFSLNLVVCIALALLASGDVTPDRREPVDAFRMIEGFPRIAIVYASANDTDLLCATGNRTHLDRETKKSTYVWDLKGLQGSVKRNVTFDLEEGGAPDLVTYYIDNDRTQAYTARYPYTDYSSCMIIEISLQGHHQCMLWVKPAVVDHVPRRCRNAYKQKCHVPVTYPMYDSDLC